MSDESVHRATGQTWDEWFGILDAKGSANLPHKEIATYLQSKHELSGWWSQMITVTYERARGKRVKNQKCDGSFSANVSRTVAVPVAKLFAMWTDAKLRSKWLPGAPLRVSKATTNKSLRLIWDEGRSRVNVGFVAMGRSKSQVALGHDNLPNIAAVKRSKAYWSEALERMKIVLARNGSG